MESAAGSATIVMADSPDVAASIGRSEFLVRRLAAASPGTAVSSQVVAAARCDVLAQQLTGRLEPPANAPGRIDDWLRWSTTPPPLPDDTIALVSSMATAVTATVLRRRTDGRLIQLPDEACHDDEQAWLDANCADVPPETAGFPEAIAAIARILAERGIAWMIFNVSTFDPAGFVHWHRAGDPEPYAVSANRLNVVVDPLPKDGVAAVVDVDRIVAELGADSAVVARGGYSAEAHAQIAAEAASTLADIPSISDRFSTETMRLEVPRYDRRTGEGVIATWHVAPPALLSPGDAIFDVRFENLRVRPGATTERESHRALHLSVIATRPGYLREVTVSAGERVAAGSTVGIVTRGPDTAGSDVTDAAHFPVGVKVRSR